MNPRQIVGLLGLVLCGGLALLIAEFGGGLVLGAVLALGLAAVLLALPELSTLIVMFVMYTNLAVIGRTLYGVPEVMANSFGLLLGLPLVSYLVVQRQKLVIDTPFLLMLVFLAALLASSIAAVDMDRALDRVSDYLMEGLVFYFLIINVVRKFTTLRWVVWALLLAGSLLGAIALYQEVTHSYHNEFGGLAPRGSEEVSGEIGQDGDVNVNRAGGPVDGDPNRFGQIMVVLLPLALFRIWGERSIWLRAGAAVAFLLILGGMLLTYSRGAFVAFALLIVVMVFMRYIRPGQLLLSLGALVLLITLAAPGFMARISTLRGVEGLVSEDAELQPDSVTRSRVTEMLAALHVFMDYPVFGVGPGQYSKYYSIDYQLNPDIALRYIPDSRRAHTLYFELGAETGVFGLGTFLAIAAWVLYRLWLARQRWLRTRPDLANMAAALWLGIVGYLGTAIFLHLSYQRYYWLIVALAGAALQIFAAEEAHQPVRAPAVAPVGRQRPGHGVSQSTA